MKAICALSLAGATVLLGQGRGEVSQARTPGAAQLRFEDVTSRARLDFRHVNGASSKRYLPEIMSGGGLFFDYDNDGWTDIFLVDGGSLVDRRVAGEARHRLFHNRGDGTFEDVTHKSGITHREYGMGACAADIDNDGLIDLYVTGFGSNTLYRNKGGGAFADITQTAGVGASQWSTSCAFGDFDKDGYVDLFVVRYVDARPENNTFCGDAVSRVRTYCHPLNFAPLTNVLYHNNGNGTFTDVSTTAGISTRSGNGLGVVVSDYDDDGWPDIFVANDTTPNSLFHNEGRGIFKDVALQTGIAVAGDGNVRAGMGIDLGDYDGDGRLDLFVTNHEQQMHTLFRNLGHGLFEDVTTKSSIGLATLPFVGFGTVFFDADNDGHLDIAVANGHVLDNSEHFRPGSKEAQRKLLFRNEGGGRFTEVGRLSGPGFALERIGRGLAAADIDNDGDLDLLVTNNGTSVDLLRNDSGHVGNALSVKLAGTRSNRSGIGARVRLTAGGVSQVREVKAGSSYLVQSDLRLHFGVGLATRIDRLEIRWPAGGSDVAQNIPVNQVLTIVEGKGVTTRTPFVRR